MVDEPCQRCGKAPAVRLLGTVAHCHECAEAFLAPIRMRVPVLRIHRPEVLGPSEWIPDMQLVRCRDCGASWDGSYYDECRWCVARDARMQDDERKQLLWPSWSVNGNGSRYDALSDADKEVWRKTRGQRDDADSMVAWVRQLAAAIADGSISKEDAQAAVKRVTNDDA